MIVARRFNTEREMLVWLDDESNLASLKKMYPPKSYKGEMNLVDKQIEITEKKVIK